jgi:hypothetical protein
MKIEIVSVVTASLLLSAALVVAQPRGGRGGGQGGWQRSGGSSQPQRSFNQDRGSNRNFSQPQRNFNAQPQRNFTPQRSFTPQRDFNANRNFTPNRSYTPGRSFTPNRSPVVVQRNYTYAPRINYGGYRGGGYRPIHTYHYVSRPRVVVSIGGPYRTIPFGGLSYNYYNGYWYRPYGSSFHIILPPIGIRIGTLPIGYSPVFGPWGNYYYYNNVFYRQPVDNSNDYEVVDTPIGAQVPELPKGAEVRVIDAQKYYELDGTFYKEDLRDGQIWYTVVGKNGVLSTDGDLDDANAPADNLSNGDRISTLPDGSKLVNINGQDLYMAPNGNYYQKVIDGDNTWYEMVGK